MPIEIAIPRMEFRLRCAPLWTWSSEGPGFWPLEHPFISSGHGKNIVLPVLLRLIVNLYAYRERGLILTGLCAVHKRKRFTGALKSGSVQAVHSDATRFFIKDGLNRPVLEILGLVREKHLSPLYRVWLI